MNSEPAPDEVRTRAQAKWATSHQQTPVNLLSKHKLLDQFSLSQCMY